MPAAGVEGQRLHFADVALHRQRLTLEFKIQRSDIAGSNNNASPSADGFFSRSGQRLLRGHLTIDSDGYPGILTGLDAENEVVWSGRVRESR